MANAKYWWILSLILFWVYALLMIAGCRQKITEVKTDTGALKERYSTNSKGDKDGLYESWLEDGTLFEKATYKDGKLVGERILYYPNGNPEIIEVYDESGQLHGPYKTFYDNGNLKSEKTYVHNVLQGIARGYHMNGKLKEEVIFTDNSENGPFTEYHPNGVVQWKGTYLNGDNEFGLLEEFDSTGVLIKKMMCDSQAVCRTIWKKEM